MASEPARLPKRLEVALTSGLHGCARCGGNHPQPLDWHKFTNPVELERGARFDYWAPCPTTGDPILLFVGPVE